MAAGLSCRVCSGELRLLLSGAGTPVGADAFSPSCHELGLHGDLLICHECGSVEQPALPSGEELHALYRETRDGSYLTEEAGRRATARRLLELVAEHVPAGRLLDVGCGPGLLLDEARTAGYDVVGVELSREAALHARDALGLDVHEVALEDFDDDAGFDVVVLADVIEHVDDPVGAIARCADLLRPGGVALRRHARPVVGHRAARGAALVGLPARAHLPAPAPDAARAAGRRGTRRGGGRAARADVRGPPLGRRPRGAPRSAPGPRRRGRAARPGAGVAQPVARRRAGHPRAAGRRHRRPRPADVRPRRREVGPRRPARLPRRPDDPGGHGRDARGRRRPRPARRRREPRRHELASRSRTAWTCCATRSTSATAQVRRAATCARSSTARTSSSWSTPTTSTTQGSCRVMAQPILDGDADMVIGSRLLDDQAIAGGMPRWKWVGNRLLTEVGEQGLRRPVLGVPHRLPGVLGRPAPVDPVPAQLRSLRLRPGAVRPGHRARRAGRGDPDPDAVLPRGVERQLHDERALRPRDAGRPRPLHGGPARPELDAPAPPRGRLARAPGPVGETGCVSRRRLPRLGLAVWALLAVALVLRLGYVAATPDYAIVPRRARLRLPRALHSARRGLRPVLRPPDGVPPARLPVLPRGRVRRRRRRPRGGRRARAARRASRRRSSGRSPSR